MKLLWNETDRLAYILTSNSTWCWSINMNEQHVIENVIKMAEIIIEKIYLTTEKLNFAIKMSCSINCYNKLRRVASGVYLLGFLICLQWNNNNTNWTVNSIRKQQTDYISFQLPLQNSKLIDCILKCI